MALVSVTADFSRADETPAKGWVSIRPWLDAVRGIPDLELVTRAQLRSELVAGVWTEDVIASDDPGWLTDGPVPYFVEWTASGSYASRIIVILGPGPVDLWTLVDLADPTVVPTPVPGPPGADSTVPGPPGPTAVSSDPGNTATLGADDLIFVPPPPPSGMDQAAADARYVNTDGDTMTGELALEQGGWTPKVPTDAYHLANKEYVDATVSAHEAAPDPHPGYVNSTGDTMTGPLVVSDAHLDLDSGDWMPVRFLRDGVTRFELGIGGAGTRLDLDLLDSAGNYFNSPIQIDVGTGLAKVVSDPTDVRGIATKQYVDSKPGAPGPEGPAGPPGGAYLSAQWTFNQTTTPPPVSGGVRLNATTFAAATLLYISETDRDGLDRNAGLNVAAVGDQIMMQSAQGRALFNITSVADSGTYRTFGITLAESSGTRPSASAITTVYIITTATTHLIQDEGTTLTSRSKLNFVGAGVTASDDAANSRTLVTIPGGGGGGIANFLVASRATTLAIAGTVVTEVPFSTVASTVGSSITLTSGWLQFATTGLYHVGGTLCIYGVIAGSQKEIALLVKRGGTTVETLILTTEVDGRTQLVASSAFVLSLQAGDQIRFQVYTSTAATVHSFASRLWAAGTI